MCSSKPLSVILLAGALALVSVGSAEAQGQHARPRTGQAAGRAVPRPSGRAPYRAPAVQRNYRPSRYGSYSRPYYYRSSYYRSYYYRPYYSYYYSPYNYWTSFGWPYYGTSFGFSLAFGYPGYYYPYPGYYAPYSYPPGTYGGVYPTNPSYSPNPSYPAGEAAPPPDTGVQAQQGGFGTLSVRVRPADAEILVDGESWQGPNGSDRLVLQLSVGTHRVEITKDGYETYSADVEVHAGGTTPLNVSILPKQTP
jgi:hypothetical protein